MVNLTCVLKVTRHILGDMPRFTNTQQLFSRAGLVLVWLLEVVETKEEWDVPLLDLKKVVQSSRNLQKLCKNSACFCVDFGSCRGNGKTFSKAASRMEVLGDPEQPQVGRRKKLSEG